LNKLVYVSYNKKMANRFQKIRELGSKGKKSSPLLLQEFQWENEWDHENLDNNNATADENSLWEAVDEAVGATEHLSDRNLPRAGGGGGNQTYSRTRKRARGSNPLPPQADNGSDSDEEMQGDGHPANATAAATSSEHPTEDGGDFELADDMLIYSPF
jgi:hypothetical protein